ncbi:MAG: hypothetical protein PUE12_10850 [Oscillospiraceae bacterium]|nr:hypothetical protein [Oscillospiraceae bacterium]
MKNRDKTNMKVSSAVNQDELKVIRRKFIVMLAAMGVLAAAILVFRSTAWFTSNKDVLGDGIQMTAEGAPYDIVCLDDSKENIFQSVHDLIKTDDVTVWQMTAQNNMENYDDDAEGLAPGSFGMVSFYVKPHDDSINLNLTFELTGYEYLSNETEGTNKLIAVEDQLQYYLNGHILLFQKRTEVINEATREVESYIYSEPVLPDDTASRVLKNKNFLKEHENTPVNIYWVWAKTLSTLVDASSSEYVGVKPFCNGDDYTKICNDVLRYPGKYLYEYSAEQDEEGNNIILTEDLIAEKYDKYGDLYDRADNQIGMNVDYITLKMSTEESPS